MTTTATAVDLEPPVPADPAPQPTGQVPAWAGDLGQRLVGRLRELEPRHLASAAQTALTVILGSAAIMAIVVGVVALAALDTSGSPADWARVGVLLVGMGLAAALQIAVEGSGVDGLDVGVNGQVSLGVTPLTISILVAAVAYWLGRRDEKRQASVDVTSAVVLAGLTGLASSVIALVLALATRGAVGFGVGESTFSREPSVEVGASPWGVLVGALVLVGGAVMLGRLAVIARREGHSVRGWVSARAGAWAEDLRTTSNLLGAVLGVTILAVMGVGIWSLATDSSLGFDGGWVPAVLGLLLLPNVLVTLVGFFMGGSFGASSTGDARSDLFGSLGFGRGLDTSVGLFSGGLPGWVYGVLVAMLLASLAVGVRASLRRSTREPVGPHAWRVLVLFSAVWMLLAALVPVTVTAVAEASVGSRSAGLDATGRMGIGWLSTVTAAALWAVVAAVGGPFAARLVAGIVPGLLSRLGGASTDRDWQLLLADVVVTKGSKVPRSLESAVESVRAGERPEAPALRTNPKRDRLILAVACGAFALLGLFLVGRTVVQNRFYSPEVVVSDFYAALQARDGAAALALTSPDSIASQDRSLLSGGAIKEPPTLVSVGEADVQGDYASVVVTQSVGGTAQDVTYTLVRQGGAMGVFDTWTLQVPFSELEITVSGGSEDAVTVNGIDATVGRVQVFPGGYTVAVEGSGLYQSASVHVQARAGATDIATLERSVNPDVQVAANQAVRRHLDECAASKDAQPEGCPFSYYDTSVTGVKWTITTYPTVSADVGGDGSISVTIEGGQAHLTAMSTNWDGTPSPVSDDESISDYGTVSWSGGDTSSATYSSGY